MPKKKSGGVNKSKWVTTPEIAPVGKPFCDVAYEQRCHSEPIEVLGVVFVPGQIITYRTPQDVPTEFFMHPEFRLTAVKMGVCRIDQMFRYTALTGPSFNTLAAEAEAAEPEPVTVAGGEELYPPEPEGGE